ncbi:phage tail protein [Mannheimia haemolytica]|uniref:phage tail protein n=1 Tax=Mannheimia granulomatis TaxID=85402 RepID=UPI0004AEFE1A
MPLATLLKKGITKLFSGLDSDAEDMAATPKAIKALKSLIDAITRNLGNYIPNSKKSNAINSNSADMVATSLAVKTAYDLADAAYKVDTSNQNQNLNSLLGQNTVFGTSARAASTTGLGDIYNYGVGLAISASGARAMLYIPHSYTGNNRGVWVQSSFAGNSSTPHWVRVDGADFGDIRSNPFTVAGYTVRSSTAYLTVHATNSAFAGFEVDRSGTGGNWQSRLEALPDRRWKFWNNSDNRGFEQFLPAKSGTIALMDDVNARVSKSGDTMTGTLAIKNGDYSALNTYNSANWSVRWESAPQSAAHYAAIVLANNNGAVVHRVLMPKATGTVALEQNVVSKSGDTMTGNLAIRSGDYSKVELFNNANKRLIIEATPDSTSSIGNIIYRNASNGNEAAIGIPRKNGTMALIEDFSYQKIGNFEVRKYPDGTMIQTCLHRNGGLNYNRNPNDNSDLVTLVYPSVFVDMPVVNITQHLSHPYFDDSRGGLTTNDKSKRLGSPLGEANDGSIGLTIDNSRTQCQFTYANNAVFISEVTFHILAIGRWK